MKCGKQTESAFLKEFFAMLMLCLHPPKRLFRVRLRTVRAEATLANNISREDPPGPMEINNQVTQVSKYVPAHRVEFVKRLPIIALPTAWNSAPGKKTNSVKYLYLKELKSLLLAAVPV